MLVSLLPELPQPRHSAHSALRCAVSQEMRTRGFILPSITAALLTGWARSLQPWNLLQIGNPALK